MAARAAPRMLRLVQSCPALTCPVLRCPVLSCPVLSYPKLSCAVLSWPASSSAALSCPFWCCGGLSCPVLSCPVGPCPVLSSRVPPCCPGEPLSTSLATPRPDGWPSAVGDGHGGAIRREEERPGKHRFARRQPHKLQAWRASQAAWARVQTRGLCCKCRRTTENNHEAPSGVRGGSGSRAAGSRCGCSLR